MTTSDPNSDLPPAWRGSGWIIGAAGVLAAAYPVRGGRKNDVNGEKVEFDILAPVELDSPLGIKPIRQEVQMRVSAQETHVLDWARETLSEIADVVSFASGRRVKLSLGSFTNAPPGITTGDYRTILPLMRVPAATCPMPVSPDFLMRVATSINDTESERRRRLTRGLRWLRRSCTAPDEFSEFTALAFAYESLTSLLPAPARDNSKQPPARKKGGSKEKKPDSSEKLRHWAIDHAKIKPEDWTRVGRLRHSLFHGGLTENPETSAAALQTIPLLRFALTTALKHVLCIPPDGPPSVALPPVVIVTQITVPGVVQTKPPETEADEA